MKHIFGYLIKYKNTMFVGFLIKVLGTFMDLGLPWVLAFIIDEVTPKKKVGEIILWGFVMILMAILARTFNVIANRKASKVARDVVEEIRSDLFSKIMTLSSSQIDTYTVPSLISRLTSDTYNIHQMIGMMQRIGVRAPIIITGGIVITMTLEPVLSLIMLAMMPLLFGIVYFVSKKGIPGFRKVQESVDHLVCVVRENITGIRVIKALSKTEYEKNRFRSVNQQLVGNEQKAQVQMAISGPSMNLLMNLGLTFVVILGAYRVNAGSSQVGKIVAFLSYFTIMIQALMTIPRIFVVFTKSSASGRRVAEVLLAEQQLGVMSEEKVRSLLKEVTTDMQVHNDSDYGDTDNSRTMDTSSVAIEFRDVCFSYHKCAESQEESICLNHISFSLKKGESLGIIGETGAGKTTMINLLMRFYEVDSGQILISGRDIRTIPMKELREKFGVVFQNDTIFAQTVGENIRFCRELTQEQIEKASEYAQAKPFIETLENQYEEPLAAKGSNLSGGQKQRVLIARALADQPEILILDDSSSALDYKTDAKLRKEIQTHFHETTSIIIAQRISSIMNLEKILVLENGRMIGLGTHENLMKNCLVYQEIYQSQMGEGER